MTSDLTAWIEGADTFFVASGTPNGALDVSHRGGTPGFVRVRDGILRIPDFPGNSMFNTLGNFAVDSRAAIVVPDFSGARQIVLSGTTELDLDGDPDRGPLSPTGGTGRWWSFRPTCWTVVPSNRRINWGDVEPSPFNPPAIGLEAA